MDLMLIVKFNMKINIIKHKHINKLFLVMLMKLLYLLFKKTTKNYFKIYKLMYMIKMS